MLQNNFSFMVASILSLVSGKNALLCFPSVQHLRQAQTFSSFFDASWACYCRDLKSRIGEISNVNFCHETKHSFYSKFTVHYI